MPLYTILPSRDFKHTECLPSVFSRISGINIITSNIQIMLVHCTVNLHVYRNIPICWSSVRIYTGTYLHQRDLAESSLSPNKWFLQRKYSYMCRLQNAGTEAIFLVSSNCQYPYNNSGYPWIIFFMKLKECIYM